nr:phosphatase domain-containing protein [Sorangium cellulosum]
MPRRGRRCCVTCCDPRSQRSALGAARTTLFRPRTEPSRRSRSYPFGLLRYTSSRCAPASFTYALIGNRAIAEKKLENFVEYRRLYPEYDFVFVGDSGQGDIHFGQRMLELAPEAVRAVFIHDVVATPEHARRELAIGGVRLFDTYIGAALAALDLGLRGPEGAARVAEAPLAAFTAIPFPSDADRRPRRLEVMRDIAELNERLPPGALIQVDALIQGIE